MQELAFFQELRCDVFGYFLTASCKLGARRGNKNMREHRDQNGNQHAEVNYRPSDPQRRSARRLQNHHFRIRAEAICDIYGGHECRNRQYNQDDIWQGEQGELQKHQCRLAIADQLVKQANCAVHPIYGYQNKREEAEQDQQLRQHVSVESCQTLSSLVVE